MKLLCECDDPLPCVYPVPPTGIMCDNCGKHLMPEKGDAAGLAALAAKELKYPQPPSAAEEGWKLLKDSTFDERSFHEDAPLENGCYYCDCLNCGRSFTGYKRRTLCKVCTAPSAERTKEEK